MDNDRGIGKMKRQRPDAARMIQMNMRQKDIIEMRNPYFLKRLP